MHHLLEHLNQDIKRRYSKDKDSTVNKTVTPVLNQTDLNYLFKTTIVAGVNTFLSTLFTSILNYSELVS